MLKLLLSTVMTVATTTVTELYKDVYLPRLALGLVKLITYVRGRPLRPRLVGFELGRIVSFIM